MSVLTGSDAVRHVEAMLDPDLQQQMCGVELTLKRVERFTSSGAIDYDNSERTIANTEEITFDATGWLSLLPGAYLITFNEIVNIPRDATAIARPRSSLLRSGATLGTALWDPGYRGRSQSILVVHNEHGLRLKRNARLIQLVFMKLCRDAEKTYSGVYQGENL